MGSSSPTGEGTSTMARSLPAPRTAAPVAVGDLLLIAGSLVAGELRHGIDPLAEPLTVLDTLVPFLAGWVLLSLLVGAYDDAVLSGPVSSVRVGAGAWIGAANVGLILRQSPYFHGDVTYPFPFVVTGTVLVLLVAWRAVVPALLDRRD